MHRSRAKLRTRTGCLRCRQRRKKCDETQPRCVNCTRINLVCEWPSGNEPQDGRRGKRRRNSEFDDVSTQSPPCLSIVKQPSSSTMPAPFNNEEYCYLYHQFISSILPRLVRKSSIDQTYMLCLAPDYPPLMGAMISVAGMQIAPRPTWSVKCAVRSYLYTITWLQKSLMLKKSAKDGDSLLATVILLSVFEACRLDVAPNVAPHTTASGYLLTQRQSQLIKRSTTTSTAIFDRICIESFIYHASLMMLFEPELDILTSIRQQLDIPRYFSDVKEREISLPVQPILQTSYEFFLLIADATKLARISRSLVDGEKMQWFHYWRELSRWKQIEHTNDLSIELYYGALQILLLKKAPNMSQHEKASHLSESLQRGLKTFGSLAPELYAPSYLLWPLAILGSISILEEERELIKSHINLLIQSRRGGQALWVQKRLDRVWSVTISCESYSYSQMRLQGLQLLLDAT